MNQQRSPLGHWLSALIKFIVITVIGAIVIHLILFALAYWFLESL